MQKPGETFLGIIKTQNQAKAKLQKSLDVLVWLRFAVFIGTCLAAWFVFDAFGVYILIPLVVGGGIFVGLIRFNNRLKAQKAFHQAMITLNQLELDRLEMKLEDIPTGEVFKDDLHPYSSDLDLFGQNSIFQLLNRATTSFGIDRLVSWMLKSSPATIVKNRQPAVKELKDKLNFRQELQAEGLRFEASGESFDGLEEWLNKDAVFLKSSLYFILPLILALITNSLVLLYFIGMVPYYIPLLMLVGHLILLRKTRNHSNEMYESCEGKVKLIKSYGGQLGVVEQATFEDGLLKELQEKIVGKSIASDEIQRLAKIFEYLEYRLNGLGYAIANLFFFWDIWWVRAAEKWKIENKDQVLEWFDGLGEIEALSSLSAVSFANTDWNFPEISEGQLCIVGTEMGHPLISLVERISNDMDLDGNGKVWLITGSNMSGKSTWLRTVGLNVVLGLMGGPVCAKSLKVSPMNVFTGMRTSDNLVESTSSFYAELKRLKQCIEVVEKEPNTLFLLDEILKGTNSKDRHNGARALIKQLAGLGGSGMVSTHDLELAELESTMAGKVFNYSFNSKLKGEDELHFDYQLEKGSCYSLNASILMRNMGIEV